MCKRTPYDSSCDALVLGSLMKGFLFLGVAENFDHSNVGSIKKMFNGIESLQIEIPPSKALSSHKDLCDPLPQLLSEVRGIICKSIKGIDMKHYKARTTAAVAKWEIFNYS